MRLGGSRGNPYSFFKKKINVPSVVVPDRGDKISKKKKQTKSPLLFVHGASLYCLVHSGNLSLIIISGVSSIKRIYF